MINLKNAENEFIKYTKNFNLKDNHLKRKYLHSLRVMEISNKIAKNIKLKDEEVEIATLIGLLHDIGRFEQFTKYGTFRDRESIDHGDFGVEILKEDNYIKKYLKDEEYIDIVYMAIKNHNKYKIENGLSEKQEMFCKIIRDADKIDIFYEMANIFYDTKEIEEINKSIIKDNIIAKIYEKEAINRKEFKEKGKLIQLLVMLAFLFDINYKVSLEIISKEKYIDKVFQRFNFEDEYTRNKMKEIQKFLNQYIDNNNGLF